jgi:hypothetical protein
LLILQPDRIVTRDNSYVSARRLFWVIRELQAVANGRTAAGTF